jgi:uncharacterized protein (DUF488 family)
MEQIYTLGTSNRPLDEFLEILKQYKIEVVIDVRRWPTSRLFPHFKKENLESALKENGIEYFHFEKLGGFRKGGYLSYTKTKEFNEALENLIRFAKKKNVLLICAEKFPWKCHRAFIAQELENKEIKVIHIITKEKVWIPEKEPKEIKPVCQKFLEKEEGSKSKEDKNAERN